MSKIASIVAIAFATFGLVSMLVLFKFNVENSGALFAVGMIALCAAIITAFSLSLKKEIENDRKRKN